MKTKFTSRSISLILAVLLLVSSLAVCVYAQDEIKSGIGFVTASALRLRSGPSTDDDILDLAYNGDAVVVLEQIGEWYRVIFNLQEGYMHSDYLSVLDRENAELGYGRFNAYCVNLRSGPSTDYPVVDQAYEGARAYIIGLNCGWYKVIYKDNICYVRSDLLDLTEFPYENRASENVPMFFRGGFSIGPDPSPAALNGDFTTDSGSTDDNYDSNVDYGSDTDSDDDDDYDYSEDYEEDYDDNEETDTSSDYNAAGYAIVSKAKEYLGVPYVWGGSSPSGFDCSGYIQYVLRACGYSVGRGTDAQYEAGYAVSRDELIPGDLVFFAGTYDTTGTSHVGIYVGDGEFIHSSNTGVKISSLYSDYYLEHYYGARRIV